MDSPYRPRVPRGRPLAPVPTQVRPGALGEGRRISRPIRRSNTLTRRYEMLWLEPDGTIGDASRVAPATAAFEDAFAAFGRGTLIATTQGPVAVEDLLPGTMVETVADGPQPLLWSGSMMLFPDPSHGAGGEAARLTRFSSDALGPDRPAPDLMLGPRARLLYRHARCRDLLGSTEAFAPARAFTDGVSVVEVVPVSAVKVYHLAFGAQHAILANGIEVETYHPGPQPEATMSADMLAMFLTLFPHIETLRDFGPMTVPRLTAFELENLRAA